MNPPSGREVPARGPGGPALAGRPDFRLARARVFPSTRRIEGPASSASLEPRVMRVLLAFVDAGPVVLTRDQLMRECWDGAVVGDDAINRTIAEIRKVARETDAGFGIDTIARVGYRLTQEATTISAPAPVAEIATAPAAAPATPPRSSASRRRALAGILAAAVVVATSAGIFQRRSRDARFAGLVERAHEALRLGLPGAGAQARELLEEAVRVRSDPTAYGLLALARYRAAGAAPPGDAAGRDTTLQDSMRAAQQALAIDATEPYARLVMTLLEWRGDWHETERRLRDILRTDPANFAVLDDLVALLQGAGYVRESDTVNEQALKYDSQRPNPAWRKALKLWIMGRPAEAVVAANAVLDRWSDNQLAWQAALVVFAFTEDFPAARRLLGQPGDMLSPEGRQAWHTWLQALEERTPVATKQARDATVSVASRPVLASHAILVLSELGELDAAYELFESRGFLPALNTAEGTTYENVASRWHQWLFCPAAAKLVADPRFERASGRLGLTAYWRARGRLPDISPGEWARRAVPAG